MTYAGIQFNKVGGKECEGNAEKVIGAIRHELFWVGTVSLVFLLILIPAMVVAYCYLRKALNTHFPVTLTKEKWNIKFLFTVFIVTYFLRLLYALVSLVLRLNQGRLIDGLRVDIGN